MSESSDLLRMIRDKLRRETGDPTGRSLFRALLMRQLLNPEGSRVWNLVITTFYPNVIVHEQ